MSNKKLNATLNFVLIRYKTLVAELDGRVFYREGSDGVLRRWHPPEMVVLDAMLKELEKGQDNDQS